MEAILRVLSEDRRRFRRLPWGGQIVPMPLALPMDLPVVEQGKVVGIITTTDLLRAFTEVLGGAQKESRGSTWPWTETLPSLRWSRSW
jgi:CBS domain